MLKNLSHYEQYTSKGIPVVVGEYGCMNKDNSSEGAYYLEGMNRIFKNTNLLAFTGIRGWYDRSEKPDYSFALVDRENGKPIDKNHNRCYYAWQIQRIFFRRYKHINML